VGVLQRLAQTVENFVKTSVALNLVLNDYQSVHAFSAVTNGGIEGGQLPPGAAGEWREKASLVHKFFTTNEHNSENDKV